MERKENMPEKIDRKKERTEEYALSKRELEVMNVIWAEGKPIIASQIPERKPELSINTVQSVLKKLLKKGFIEVGDIVRSGTVLSRSYIPSITPEEYAAKYVTTEIFPYGKMLSGIGYLSALFDSAENREEMIGELEKFIQDKKRR